MITIDYDEDSRLLCQTGYMNSDGYCSSPPISVNAGQKCELKDDCVSSEDGIKANCSCTFN